MNGPLAFSDGSARGWLAAVDPRLKIAWIACVSLASVLVHSQAALAAMMAVAALPAAGLKLRLRAWLAIGAALLLVAWGAVVTQGVFYAGEPRTALVTFLPHATLMGWEFPGIHFYREGAIYGLTQSARWLALSIMGLTVCLSTSPERLLAALVRLRVPTAVAFMALAAM
ncbi:MAG TPA: energy-coupling factor transporter transmembrane component T, partial [Pirellulales bacterium]|nr:energy-coupling factor transporter transmembrane component T [Pirellulales bacterium]